MGRAPRLECAGAYHHIMNRGGGWRDIFVGDRDRWRFLQLLGEAHDRFDFEVHAYCLMGNHFHLLTRSPLANVGESMHHITSCYSSWSNDRRATDGSLFRGRYLAKHVDQDNYLLHVSRYIHLNPVEAAMVTTASQYRWSSMANYLGLTPRPPWLYTGHVLAMIGGSTPRVDYAHFVPADPGTEDPAWYQHDERNSVRPPTCDSEVANVLSAIDSAVAQAFNVNVTSIRHGTSGQSNVPRMVALGVIRALTAVPLREIAEYYNFGGPSSVSSALDRLETLAGQDQGLVDRLQALTVDLSAET